MKLHYGGQRSRTQCRRLEADDLVLGPRARVERARPKEPGARGQS